MSEMVEIGVVVCMHEHVVRVRLLWVDYLGYSVEVLRVGIQNRLVYGIGVLEYSSFSGFYSDYLSEFRFYEVLGILI